MLNIDYQVSDSSWYFTAWGDKCEQSIQYHNKESGSGQLPLETYSLAYFTLRYLLGHTHCYLIFQHLL